MKSFKRMAALLLAVVLVLSCFPAASVFAEELPEGTVPETTAAADAPTTGTDPPVTVETQPPEITEPAETTAPTTPEETTVPTDPPETIAPEETAPTEPIVPAEDATEPTGEVTDPTGESTVPAGEATEPEPTELYRAATEDGSVTAVLFGTAENPEASGFQVTVMEANEELADSLAQALYDYTGTNYAPLAVLPIQVGFSSGALLGNFTLKLTLPGEQLQGDLFVFRANENYTAVIPDVPKARDGEAGAVTVSIPLTELSSGVFTVATAEPVAVDGGSSGSTIGSGGGIGGVKPGGSGKNLGVGVGVTMQVVYYKYKDCYNRDNSYQCVVDTLLHGKDSPHPALDDDGTVLSNTVLDGYTWLKRNTFWFSTELGMTTLRSYEGTESERGVPKDVRQFITRIIMGNKYGAWDKQSVGTDASLYTHVLRTLHTPEQYIQNYLKSFNDELSVEKDGETLIPTIIWAWYGQERISQVTGYLEALSGSILSKCIGGSDQFLKTAYSSPSALRNRVNCYWCSAASDSMTCQLLLGKHNCNGPGVYPWSSYQDFYGTGFVNMIQANGVDSSDAFYYFRGYWTPYGEVEAEEEQPLTLQKSIDASDDCIAQLQDNAMYTLAGAKYDVIIDGTVVETITTDADGNAATTKKFKPGTTGTVVETVAPKGFRLDSTPVPFTVPSSGKCVVNVSDVPIMDPPFAITKVDKDTTTPQGDGSFSGAVFRFEYFDNDSWSGTAKRTWYFKTNENGVADYAPSALASGYASDTLYIGATGEHRIPLGTLKITEIKNSLGYVVIQTPLFCSIVEDASSIYGAKTVWTPESLDILVDMASGNFGVYEPIDTSVMGSLTIQKKDKDFGTTAPTWATLAGCEFTVYNRSKNPVKVGENEIVQPDEACLILTVDEAGLISTGNVFPVGSYEVKETKGNDYYQCNEEWSYTFTVTGTETSPVFMTECADTMRPAALHLSKTNTEGNPLPGSKFCLEWSADGDVWAPVTKADDIVMGGCDSPELDENGCLTVGEDGTLSFTGLHPVVYYRITEVETLNGYQLLKEPILTDKLLPESNFEKSYRVVNNDMFTLPKTGGNGFLAVLLPAGFLLALSGTAMLMAVFGDVKRRKRSSP